MDTLKVLPQTPSRENSNLSNKSEKEKGKDPVSVFCRLRNLHDENQLSCIKLISPTVLSISCPTELKVQRKDMEFSFKHIFTSYASQKEVFEHVALPLVEDLLNANNGLLFTYGVTGSGKTFTLTGDPYHPGIMPRCIDTIFNSIGEFQAPKYLIKSDKMNGFEIQSENDALEDQQKMQLRGSSKTREPKISYLNDGTKILGLNETNLYAVFISYTEIYNNIVYDLLDEIGGKILQSKILREDQHRNMYVNGVVEVEVKTAAEAFDLFNCGQKRKRMAHTLLNAESSRSHSIFNIRIVQFEQVIHNSRGDRVVPDRNFLKVGQLSLVDLAGSERTNRTHNSGMRLKEASSINNSLMTLRSCIEILRDNQMNNANKLVPYRDNRLTLLFKNYFEGDGKVNMIVCVNPAALDYEENLQVMKFAELAKDVKVIKPESRYTPYRKDYRPTPAKSGKIKTKEVIIFGPKLPRFTFDLDNIENTLSAIDSLDRILHKRKQKSAMLNHEIVEKQMKFRKRLLELQQNHILKTTELQSSQQQYKKERKKNHNLEIKVLELEKVNDSLETKCIGLSEAQNNLKKQLNEKDLKLNQNAIEREKQKQKIALKQEKMSQELDEKLRRQRDLLNATMLAKEQKLQRVRDVIDQDSDLETVTPILKTPVIVSEREMETQTVDYNPPMTPKPAMSSRRHFAVANRRRSKSVGEVWLEHNCVKPVPLGTVMKPSMKRRKSVSKLSKASDITNTKQSKYCLVAQEADTDGEIETKVYKGDIVPTCGGGAQVIFNDVERLRQESPISSPK